MSWRDLLDKSESVQAPWLGGRRLRQGPRTWKIEHGLPREHGWYTFALVGRKCSVTGPGIPDEPPFKLEYGYLVGDRFVAQGARIDPDPRQIAGSSESIHLVEEGLDRFTRVSCGRMFEDGPLIYWGQEFPLGPEPEVLDAFLDEKESVSHVKDVTPALDASFRLEVFQRAEAARRRAEAARRRAEAEAARAQEERRRDIQRRLGDGGGRRAMAQIDFGEAARAALAVGGATLLDHRASVNTHEMVVRFRLDNRRFECTCDNRTLQIIDSGICLTAEYDSDEWDRGEQRDRFFTLESLPSVIREAIAGGVLVVYRRVA
jgi:hypothetical protein